MLEPTEEAMKKQEHDMNFLYDTVSKNKIESNLELTRIRLKIKIGFIILCLMFAGSIALSLLAIF